MSTPAYVYCSPEDVARICNLTDHQGDRAVFDENITTPSRAEIIEFINDAEEAVEDKCTLSWGTRFMQVSEELKDLWSDYQEYSVSLDHTNIAPFDTEENDKLEVWDNNNWTDYITTKTEDRGEDFFVDYQLGKIYFLRSTPKMGLKRLRATYRYNGGDIVPRAVKVATALTVGILLANSEQVDIMFPEGASSDFSTSDMISRWEKYVGKLLKVYDATVLNAGLAFTPINIR